MNLKPLDGRILIEPVDVQDCNSMLVMPEIYREAQRQFGVVYAVGEGRRTRKGAVIVPEVKPGDMIVFKRNEGTEHTVNGKRMFLLPDYAVLATVSAL